MRTSWGSSFPPVFVHVDYSANESRPGLSDHECYAAAKTKADMQAAMTVVEDVLNVGALDDICDFLRSDRTKILAPARTPSQSGNALSIAYAHVLGSELGFAVENRVFQDAEAKRDLSDYWHRMASQPSFYGEISAGFDYILVDDVVTLGGTLATLKGFVENQGCKVVCMTSLARRGGKHMPISLAPATRFGLDSKHGSELDLFWREEFGYEIECLTEPEAQGLLRCASIDAIRKGLDGASDG